MLKLDAQLVEGFQTLYLHERFDAPAPLPPFHRKIWELACSDAKQVVIAAPRGHAKSTGVTHTLSLVLLLFRFREFGVIVADTEGQASQFLRDIKVELQENEAIIRDFRIVPKFDKDTDTEIVVSMQDGHKFCLMAKGSEQKVRGLKWRNKRPDFILGDDLENDEIVLNSERRAKFKSWVFSALLPCGSPQCITRVVGTVLHQDSFLENVLTDPENWASLRFGAHKDFDDFSNILWPERYSEAVLRKIRQNFISQGLEDKYSQEYLNQPLSPKRRFFNSADFKEYDKSDYAARKTYYCGVDFAISKSQRADYTVFVVVGITPNGIITVEDIKKGRWDSKEIIDQWFDLDAEFRDSDRPIELYVCEQGAIQKSLGPFLKDEMSTRDHYLNLKLIVPSKDKESRAKPIAGRVKAGKVRFDKEADWWPSFEDELSAFPRGKHDDQVDAFAYIGLILDKLLAPPSDDELEEDEWQELQRTERRGDPITGY